MGKIEGRKIPSLVENNPNPRSKGIIKVKEPEIMDDESFSGPSTSQDVSEVSELEISKEELKVLLEEYYISSDAYDDVSHITNPFQKQEKWLVLEEDFDPNPNEAATTQKSATVKRKDDISFLQHIEDSTANLNSVTKLKNIFTNENGEEGRRILIKGSPGIGKTTLCKKLVQDFYQKTWNNFPLVLWIPLCKFTNLAQPVKTNDLIFNAIFEDEILKRGISRYKGDVLYLLDGFDELEHVLLDEHNFIQRAIVDKLLQQKYIIVTSRPHVRSFGNVTFDKIFDAVNFSENTIWTYIKDYFSDEKESQTDFMFEIHENNVLFHMTNSPTLLATLCYFWKDLKPQIQLLESQECFTRTSLHKMLFSKSWNLQLKINNISGTRLEELYLIDTNISQFVAEEIHCLRKLAYYGIVENRTLFTMSDSMDFSKNEVIGNLVRNSHFFKSTDATDKNCTKFEFVHLSFQEFAAAIYVYEHLLDDEMKISISKNKYNPNFRNVWPFVSGLIQTDWPGYSNNFYSKPQNLLNYFLNVLEDSPVDIIGAHQTLMIDCVAECYKLLSNNAARRNRLLNYFEETFHEEKWGIGDTISLNRPLPSEFIKYILRDDFALPPSSHMNKLEEDLFLRCTTRSNIGPVKYFIRKLKTVRYYSDYISFRDMVLNSSGLNRITTRAVLREIIESSRNLRIQNSSKNQEILQKFYESLEEKLPNSDKEKLIYFAQCLTHLRNLSPKTHFKMLDLFLEEERHAMGVFGNRKWRDERALIVEDMVHRLGHAAFVSRAVLHEIIESLKNKNNSDFERLIDFTQPYIPSDLWSVLSEFLRSDRLESLSLLRFMSNCQNQEIPQEFLESLEEKLQNSDTKKLIYSAKCLKHFKNLSPDTLNKLLDLLLEDKLQYDTALDVFENQKYLDERLCNRLLDISIHNFNSQMNSSLGRILEHSKNTESILNTLIYSLEEELKMLHDKNSGEICRWPSREAERIMLCLFESQKYLPESVFNNLGKVLQDFACPNCFKYILPILTRHKSKPEKEGVIQLQNLLSKSIMDFMETIKLLERRTLTIELASTLHHEIKTLMDSEEECSNFKSMFIVLSDYHIHIKQNENFPRTLLQLLKYESISQRITYIFERNHHFFENEEMYEYILCLLETDLDKNFKKGQRSTDYLTESVIRTLSGCSLLNEDLLLKIVNLYLSYPMKSSISTQLQWENSYLEDVLAKLLKYKVSIEGSINYILDKENWKNQDSYSRCIFGVLHFVPLSAVLKTLPKHFMKPYWRIIFANLILGRLAQQCCELQEDNILLQIHDDPKLRMKIVTLCLPPMAPLQFALYSKSDSLEVTEKINENLLEMSQRYCREDFDYFLRNLRLNSPEDILEYINQFKISENVATVESPKKTVKLSFTEDKICGYLRIQITCKENSKEFSGFLKEKLKEKVTINIRHLDLRENQLNDEKMNTIIIFLREYPEKLITLILSQNELTLKHLGLFTGLSNKLGLKYLFLDRNLMFMNTHNFDEYLLDDKLYQEPQDKASDVNREKIYPQLELLELSGNFIPKGKLCSDNIVSHEIHMKRAKVTSEEQNYFLTTITKSKILHSSATFSFDFRSIFQHYSIIENGNNEYITQAKGCIVLASIPFGNDFPFNHLKHGTILVEWIPPEENFGQRQIVMADLVLNPEKGGYLRSRVRILAPENLQTIMIDEGLKAKVAVFKSNTIINDLLKILYSDQNPGMIAYPIFSMQSGPNADRFNCNTWAETILRQVGIDIPPTVPETFTLRHIGLGSVALLSSALALGYAKLAK